MTWSLIYQPLHHLVELRADRIADGPGRRSQAHRIEINAILVDPRGGWHATSSVAERRG